MPETRKVTEIPSIGYAKSEICGNQLPSNQQVLECYYYYTRHATPKLTARKAATCVIRKCAVFWEYAGIPIVKESYAISKMEKLVQRHKNIQKFTSLQKEKYSKIQMEEINFQCSLNELFDIAHQKQVNGMRNEAAKKLLDLHREKGRNGLLDTIIDTGIWVASNSSEKEEKIERIEQAPSSRIVANYGNYLFDEDEDINELLQQIEDNEEMDIDYEVRLRPVNCKKLKIMNPDITAILDRAKVSDRMAARVLAATLMSLGLTLEEVNLSRETLRRNRQIQRKCLGDTIKSTSKERSSQILTVHWDGKQFSAPENKYEKIDRLPVLVSSHDWNQLLGVPRLEKGTGEGQARAIYDCLEEWNILGDVCAMVFDTTASNTGSINGACILLEGLLNRDLLHLACRHHIFELLLKTAFQSSMGCTSGPDVPIFKRFQGQWKNINKEEFSPGVHDATVKEALSHDIENILTFAEVQLQEKTIRKDYREFLELVVMFLGGNLMKGNCFRALGPIHHARWMSKAIYSLKIFLFRDQFHLTAQEQSGLIDICIFIVVLDQKAWFTASNAVTAPNNDLNLLKQLAANVGPSHPRVCRAVLDKFINHLWYLSEELIAFAFFDENVSTDCKRKMCQAIKSRPALTDDKKKRRTGINDPQFIEESSLDSFVTKNTRKFFEILRVDSSFLDSDPTTWEKRDDFATASRIIRSLHVTNDIAERSVALVSEYHDLLTKDESSKQNLMLVVQKLRESSSECTKENLKFSLSNYLNNLSGESVSGLH